LLIFEITFHKILVVIECQTKRCNNCKNSIIEKVLNKRGYKLEKKQLSISIQRGLTATYD
jgi:hypothetical protein